jgi:hypothetical protein
MSMNAKALPASDPSPTGAFRPFPRWLLLCMVGLETAALLFLVAGGLDRFSILVSTPDTAKYVNVARGFAEGHFVPSVRTPGYPLFLAPAYFLGGTRFGPVFAIVLQLALNLVFVWMVWRLVGRIVPHARSGCHILVTGIAFLGGLSVSILLMSDFLAGLCLTGFLLGAFFFWRRGPWVGLAAVLLFWATITRPTFTFFPIVFPLLVLAARALQQPLTVKHVGVFVVASLAGTATSTLYQYKSSGYLGPSDVVTENVALALCRYGEGPDDWGACQARLRDQIQARAGRGVSELDPNERERWAKAMLVEEMKADPSVLRFMAKTSLKYLFVPIEGVLVQTTDYGGSLLRKAIGLFWLPFWLLAYFPPLSDRGVRRYYLAAMACVLYVAAVSAIVPGAGERIRFPVLALLMPVALFNLDRGISRISSALRPSRGDRLGRSPASS